MLGFIIVTLLRTSNCSSIFDDASAHLWYVMCRTDLEGGQVLYQRQCRIGSLNYEFVHTAHVYRWNRRRRRRRRRDDDDDDDDDCHLGVMTVFYCYIISKAAVKLPATWNVWRIVGMLVLNSNLTSFVIWFEVRWQLGTCTDCLNIWNYCILSTQCRPVCDLINTTLDVVQSFGYFTRRLEN